MTNILVEGEMKVKVLNGDDELKIMPHWHDNICRDAARIERPQRIKNGFLLV